MIAIKSPVGFLYKNKPPISKCFKGIPNINSLQNIVPISEKNNYQYFTWLTFLIEQSKYILRYFIYINVIIWYKANNKTFKVVITLLFYANYSNKWQKILSLLPHMLIAGVIVRYQ